ncbi:MAG: type II toxin-antitoxin system VapC family toxin, partial [Geminicoccaceae bacterium]
MIVVVDASVAIKWFIQEPDRAAARRLLEPDKRLVAPELLVAEVANAIWKRVMAGEGDARQAPLTAASLPRFFARLVSLAPLAARALEIAAELRHPVYDCFYLALAESEDAT